MKKILPVASFLGANLLMSLSTSAQSKMNVMGNNQFAQLGLPNVSGNQTTPILLDSTATTEWLYVSAETLSNLALKADGSLWAWGRNNNGQLGNGTTTNITSPTLIDSGTNAHGKWVIIDQGGTSGIGIREDGSLWAWGSNSYGKLGIGQPASSLTQVNTPILVDSGNNIHGKWIHIDNGLSHSVGIREDGTTWAWGWNSNGQLGVNDLIDRSTPVLVDSGRNWGGKFVNINATAHFNIAIKENGSLWAWGMNTNKEVGNYSNTSIPVCIDSATNGRWKHISAGFNHSIALKADSTLWGWGKNAFGQLLGINPAEVSTLTQLGTDKWRIAEVGQNNTFGVKADGTFWAWGTNSNGQLGIGTTSNVNVMTAVPYFDNLENPIISSGLQHTVILDRVLPNIVPQIDGAIANFSVTDTSTDTTQIHLVFSGELQNIGNTTIDTAIVSLTIDGNTVFDTVLYNVNSQTSIALQNIINWQPSTAGNYNFCLFVSGINNDNNQINDTSCVIKTLTPYVAPPTHINTLSQNNSRIYPNPAQQWFTVEGMSNISKVNILDLSGRLVQQTNTETRTNALYIDVQTLKPGLYILDIQFDNGERGSQKISIRR